MTINGVASSGDPAEWQTDVLFIKEHGAAILLSWRGGSGQFLCFFSGPDFNSWADWVATERELINAKIKDATNAN